MEWWIILGFVAIAVMRVAQKICSKKVSLLVDNEIRFFHYGGYYQAVSALFALITLCFVGFYGFNLPTLLCALASAVLFAVDLYSSIEAIKGATLVVCNLFALGGMFLPCVLGIFLFDEPMGLWQWLGLVVFLSSIYFISAKAGGSKEKKPFTLKTLLMLIISFTVNGLVMIVQKYFGLLVVNGNVAMFSALTFGLNALILYACMAVACWINAKKKPAEGVLPKRLERLSPKMLLYGAVLALALFTINQLVTTMTKTVSSAVLFPVSSAISILITCIVGVVVFKEKLTVKNIVGIVLATASIVMVNLG